MRKIHVLLLVCLVSGALLVLTRCFGATNTPGETTLVGRYQLFQGYYQVSGDHREILDGKAVFLIDTITGKVKRYSDSSAGWGWSDTDYPTK